MIWRGAGASTSRRRPAPCAPPRCCADTLAAGYTTIRDAGGLDAGFKRAIDEGLIAGPRLVLSLVIISPIGGIGDRVSPSGFPCCVPNDPLLPDGVVNSLADVRPVVRRVVRAGADVIKCATTGGASSRPGHGPHDGAFNLDEMQALVEEAHALDRRVICHALGGRGLRIAVEAGVNSIDHGCYLDEEPELLDTMARARHLFRADLRRLRLPPQIAAAACPRAGRAPRRAPCREPAPGARRRGQDRRRHRCRRARPSGQRDRDRLPRPRRDDAASGIAGGDRLGRRMHRARRRISARSKRASSPISSWSRATRSPM